MDDANVYIQMIIFGIPFGFAMYLVFSLFSIGIRQLFKLFDDISK